MGKPWDTLPCSTRNQIRGKSRTWNDRNTRKLRRKCRFNRTSSVQVRFRLPGRPGHACLEKGGHKVVHRGKDPTHALWYSLNLERSSTRPLAAGSSYQIAQAEVTQCQIQMRHLEDSRQADTSAPQQKQKAPINMAPSKMPDKEQLGWLGGNHQRSSLIASSAEVHRTALMSQRNWAVGHSYDSTWQVMGTYIIIYI